MSDSKTSAVLLLVRHAKAERSHGGGDLYRALTPEGREAFREHAPALCKKVKLRGIATSPAVRAVQTAELLAAAAGVSDIVVRSELLAESPKKLLALARELGNGWAMVGHNPALASLLALALDLQEPPRLPKGAGAAVTLTGEKAIFRWLAPVGASPLTLVSELQAGGERA
jgi:phosphohistidine phosphatase